MSLTGRLPEKERSKRALTMTLIGVVGQVGCLTLAIIALALVAGLWLDNQFQTRPLLTIALVLASVPVTLFLMFRLVLSVAPKIDVAMSAVAGSGKKEGAQGGGDGGEDQQT